MIIRFYVATALGNSDRQQAMVRAIEAAGHVVTVDWHALGPVERDPAAYAERARVDADGVFNCWHLIFIVEGGRGAHWELGYAAGLKRLGLHIRITMVHHVPLEEVGPYPMIFYWHNESVNETIFADIPDYEALIRGLTTTREA